MPDTPSYGGAVGKSGLPYQKRKQYPFMFFSNVNRSASDFILKDSELLDEVNWWTERKIGAKKVRPGYKTYLNALTGPVKAFIPYKFPNGQTRLAVVSANKIFIVDPLAAPASWGTAKFTTASTNNFGRVDSAKLAARVHIVSQISATESPYLEWKNNAGTDTITEPSYAAGIDLSIPYRGKTIVTFHRRIYSGQPYYSPNVYRSRLSWSSINYEDYGTLLLTSIVPSATGGTLATGTYYYKVTALDANGIETGGIENRVNVIGATGSAVLTWNPVVQAVNYRIYRGTSPLAEDHYFTVAAPTVTFTDTGATGTAGTPPSAPWVTLDTDIRSANFRDIDLDNNGNIIKLTNINDRVNIYKEGGVYRYNENSVFDIFGLSALEGSIATMSETKEDYFLTNEGFYKTDGKDTLPVGEGWIPIIKQILQDTTFDPSKIHSHAVNFLYFCYLGDVKYDGRTVTNACFVFNKFFGEMSLWSFGHNITAIGHFPNAQGDQIVLLGDASGNTYQLDPSDATNDDASKPIQASMRTKYWFFDAPNTRNNLLNEQSAFCSLGSELEILLDRDFMNQYEESFKVSGTESEVRIDPNKMGQLKNLSAKIVWNGSGKRPEFTGLILNIAETSERVPSG